MANSSTPSPADAHAGKALLRIGTVVLASLARGPRRGYAIRQSVHEIPEQACAGASDTRLLGELRDLTAAGFVAILDTELARDRPMRYLYGLTALGDDALSEQIETLALSEPGTRDDILARLLACLPSDRADKTVARWAEAAAVAGRNEPEPKADAPDPASACDDDMPETESAWTEIAAMASALRDHASATPPSVETTAPASSATRPSKREAPGLGAFTFVLHSHLPYCRLAGRWPHGEEWIHEATAETYIPLLDALYDLWEEGVDYCITLSVSPILLEQLTDPDIKAHLVSYLDAEIRAAGEDELRFEDAGEAHLAHLARFYLQVYRQLKQSFTGRFGADLAGALRKLQDAGLVQVSTCAATHGYLPLLSRDSSIFAQIKTAVESYRRHLGRYPEAIWLPECAYRPAFIDSDGTVRPAIEEFLAPLGIRCFFAETHAIEGSAPVGKAADEVAIGPYGTIKRRYVVDSVTREGPWGTTFEAYYVCGSEHGVTDPPVAVIGRNNRTGQQVWSADWGYPGEADYREFHRKDDESGLQYWRVTGPKVDLGDKDYYHPEWAAGKVVGHAAHFASLVERLVSDYHASSGRYGIVASNYDTELFGHWWFEGITWIKEVLRRLAASDIVDLTTVEGYLREHEPTQVIALPESSWGSGGNHWTWDNEDTAFMWPQIQHAERRMEALVERYPDADEHMTEVLNQAARELLLLQSSDWPFLVTTGQAREYAIKRFNEHVERFQRLASLAEDFCCEDCGWCQPRVCALADELRQMDNPFPDIDYRWFAARQGRSAP